MSHLRRKGTVGDPTLLILISVATGPRHGHAMMLDIESFSGQRLGPGMLYGAIERLEVEGLVEALSSDDRRQPYRLSAAGATYLDAQLQALGQVLAFASERRGIAEAGSA